MASLMMIRRTFKSPLLENYVRAIAFKKTAKHLVLYPFPQQIVRRNFGLLDKIQDKIMQKQADNEAKQMKNQFKEMAQTEIFNLNVFSKQIEEGMSNWITKVPGLRNQPEIEKVTKMKKILDAMTELEKAKPERLTTVQRRRIAQDSEQGTRAVEDLLYQFEKSALLHRWLRTRAAKGQRIPRTQEELMELASRSRTQHQFMTEAEKKAMSKIAQQRRR